MHVRTRGPYAPYTGGLILTEFCEGSHDYEGRAELNAPGQAEAREGPRGGGGGTPGAPSPGVGRGAGEVISLHYHHGELMCGHERPVCCIWAKVEA